MMPAAMPGLVSRPAVTSRRPAKVPCRLLREVDLTIDARLTGWLTGLECYEIVDPQNLYLVPSSVPFAR